MNKIITTTFCFFSVLGTQAMASDIEDYAGLSIYEDEMLPAVQEVVVNEGHEGYDGLPVTYRTGRAFQSAESQNQDGYDGLPVIHSFDQTTESIAYSYREGYDGLPIDY